MITFQWFYVIETKQLFWFVLKRALSRNVRCWFACDGSACSRLSFSFLIESSIQFSIYSTIFMVQLISFPSYTHFDVYFHCQLSITSVRFSISFLGDSIVCFFRDLVKFCWTTLYFIRYLKRCLYSLLTEEISLFLHISSKILIGFRNILF